MEERQRVGCVGLHQNSPHSYCAALLSLASPRLLDSCCSSLLTDTPCYGPTEASNALTIHTSTDIESHQFNCFYWLAIKPISFFLPITSKQLSCCWQKFIHRAKRFFSPHRQTVRATCLIERQSSIHSEWRGSITDQQVCLHCPEMLPLVPQPHRTPVVSDSNLQQKSKRAEAFGTDKEYIMTHSIMTAGSSIVQGLQRKGYFCTNAIIQLLPITMKCS